MHFWFPKLCIASEWLTNKSYKTWQLCCFFHSFMVCLHLTGSMAKDVLSVNLGYWIVGFVAFDICPWMIFSKNWYKANLLVSLNILEYRGANVYLRSHGLAPENVRNGNQNRDQNWDIKSWDLLSLTFICWMTWSEEYFIKLWQSKKCLYT